MSKNLVIVESPAKAKTIEKILGKDFTVKSSMGHVRDLPKDNSAVDVENEFKPKYVVTPDKKKVVTQLKDWVKKVDEVWLATDEDREGEAISWHLCHVLGLDEDNTKRIVFHEITKPAIEKAINNPRTVDKNLVNAQQARRVLDRLVGFELSELLWKKVRRNLSAGRVQSVAVKLIVDREREIQNFTPETFFKVAALFKVENKAGKIVDLKADAPIKYESEAVAREFLESCKNAAYSIADIEVKPAKRRPAAPFTTSTLQQEASRKLGFSVKRTMLNAQRLYEQGLITYMRTDSVNLSELAIESISQVVENLYGAEYVEPRRYKGKKALAQEAHEAIRPTYIEREQVTSDRDQQRLYELIRKRTMASQMADAQLEKTVVKIAISTVPDTQLQAVGEVLKFDGFLKVYLESTDEEEDEAKGMLPPLKVGQVLDFDNMIATQKFSRPPARYTEAGLVKKMEELGIGRPSTYAPTISKIMEEKRGYVFKQSRDGTERKYARLTLLASNEIVTKEESEMTGVFKNRLVPSDMGMIVSDFLNEHFDNIMNYNFTASIEQEFDKIADGNLVWNQMLGKFYKPFHANVVNTLENAERASGERILGKDPETGRTVLVRMSRFGPVVQIGAPDELEEDEKPKYANLRPGQSMENVTFAEVIDLFQLPKQLGQYEEKDVIVAIGRFGPYVKHGDKFISIPRGEDPFSVDMARAVEIIEAKKKEDEPLFTYKGIPVTKGKGRFGPFLKWDKLYVNIPRKIDPDTLTVEQGMELLEKKIEKEANRYIQRWDDQSLSIQNGRWGPFIKYQKSNYKLPKGEDGKRMTQEEAALLSLEEVKQIVNDQAPGTFE